MGHELGCSQSISKSAALSNHVALQWVTAIVMCHPVVTAIMFVVLPLAYLVCSLHAFVEVVISHRDTTNETCVRTNHQKLT